MIKTSRFSIIDNFPFVVMFFAILQRFDKVSWGYYQEFGFLPLSVADPPGPEREPEEQSDLHKEDGFDEDDWDNDGNRGSMVQEVKRDASNPFDDMRLLPEEEMVIEVSRVDYNDTTEVDHLKKARRLAETRGDIKSMVWSPPGNAIRDNILVLIAGAVWEEPFTATFQRYRIRRPLTRRIVAMVFPKMNRMTELGGSNFAGAFLDCFNCE
jgi:hypothetical protein